MTSQSPERSRNTTLLRTAVMLLTFSLWSSLVCAQADMTQARAQFLVELNQRLLGVSDGGPLAVDPARGWTGAVLAPPGTALSPLITPFDPLGTAAVSVTKLLENVNLFDRVLFVNSGIAHQTPISIADAWKTVLDACRPAFDSDEDADPLNDPALRVLFRHADQVDQVRGVQFRREPSDAVLRYREYDELLQVLASAERNGEGTWRLFPRLSAYSSVAEAQKAIAEDWVAYGYKREVEGAWATFNGKRATRDWIEWSKAQADFEASRFPVTPESSVPLTILFPPPSEWLSMPTWIAARAVTTDPNVAILYQLARIKISRPWFDIEALLDGRIRTRRTPSGSISDGTAPTTDAYPHGAMAVYPEEIILVRGIRFVVATSPNTPATMQASHPLATFAYPNEVNLLGYLVRALPRSPR